MDGCGFPILVVTLSCSSLQAVLIRLYGSVELVILSTSGPVGPAAMIAQKTGAITGKPIPTKR